jgi:hypothetical protein
MVGYNNPTIVRSAVAEYQLPQNLGSPQNSYGNDPESAAAQPQLWGNLFGPSSSKDKGDAIQSFARNLASLTDSIRDDDPAIRSTIDQTTPAVNETGQLVDDLSPTLPVLLANLSTTGQVITAREDGLRSLLIMFPFVVAGGPTILPGDGYQHMGLVLNSDAPPPCTKGYEKTKARWPQFTKETPARTDIGCADPNPNVDVRSSRHAPKPKPPIDGIMPDIDTYWFQPPGGPAAVYAEGMEQETCRDRVHPSYSLAATMHVIATAQIQGLNLATEFQHRITAAMEFRSKYSLTPVPAWLCGGVLNDVMQPALEIAYTTYHKKVKLPWTRRKMLLQRPAGASVFMAWETLTSGSA